jgi:membrane protease YdiL (CAAX protease family)
MIATVVALYNTAVLRSLAQKERSLAMATAAPVQPAAPQRGIRALLASHPLVSFFVLAFAGTWLTELPYVLSEDGSGLLPFSSPLLVWTSPVCVFMGPFLAAFIMTGAIEGRAGVGRFLRRFVLWRVGFRWYLFAFLGIPVICVLSVVVIPGVLGSFKGLGALAPLSLLGIFVYVLFLGGALGEEPGWRGFALPRLQSMHGPLLGTLILGPLWALWHLPLFFTPWNKLTLFNVVVFVLATTCFAIMYTWVFNNTKGSVLMAILVHASFNASVTGILAPLFPSPILSDYGLLPLLGGFGALAVVLVALTRGRLGYQNHRQEVEPDSAADPT